MLTNAEMQFSKSCLLGLTKKGIKLVSETIIKTDKANVSAYVVEVNGVQTVCTYRQVEILAGVRTLYVERDKGSLLPYCQYCGEAESPIHILAILGFKVSLCMEHLTETEQVIRDYRIKALGETE